MQKVSLIVGGQSQQIAVNYYTEEDVLDELKARAQTFVAALQADDLLRRISHKVLAWVPEFEGDLNEQSLTSELQFRRFEFDDDSVAAFVVAPITFAESTIICSLSYTHPPEIQDFGMFAMNLDAIEKRKALQAAAQACDLPQLQAYAAEYNLLPPPWVTLPHAHPVNLAWDEGYGKSFTDLWSDWWDTVGYTEAEQVDYFRVWKPPHAWLEWVLFALWPDVREIYWLDDSKGYDVLLPYFARLEALGFGSFADWRTDYEREDWQ